MARKLQGSIAILVATLAAALLGGCNLDSSNASSGAVPAASNSAEANTSVTLSWMPPQTNADGTALTDLAGYHIHYGTSAASLNSEIDIPTVGVADYVIEGLKANSTYYFAISSYNTEGVESTDSAVISVGT